MFRFETLEIWQEALKYADEIYQLTRTFPKEELFGLTSQLRRAAVSISANIAEGSASLTIKEYKNFLNIARKSIFEVVSLLLVAKNQNYINEKTQKEFYNQAEILAKRIMAFYKSLRTLGS